MRVLLAVVVLATAGCGASAKIKDERLPLAKGAITKDDVIYVRRIDARDTTFKGDKEKDDQRVFEERQRIHERLGPRIVHWLRDESFEATLLEEPRPVKGIIVEATALEVNHGNAALRIAVGWGSGHSHLLLMVKMYRDTPDNLIADFDVLATSGKEGGVFKAGSFVDRHIEHAAEKIADLIDDRVP